MKTLLHTHWESAYDAVPSTSSMFDRLEEIGAEAVAVTDHGSLNALSDIYEENTKRGNHINIIYGCELYVKSPRYDADEKTAHMIILAKDNTGKRGIDKLMYLANENINAKGNPVVTYDMLKNLFSKTNEYYGHVFFTTACIAGIPSLELLANENINTQIQKLQKKIESELHSGKMILPDNKDYISKTIALETSTKLIEELRTENTVLKPIANRKSEGLKKRALTARGKGYDDKAAELELQAAEIEESAKNAKEKLEENTSIVRSEQKTVSALKESIKKLESALNRYKKAKSDIENAKQLLIEESKLYDNAKKELQFLADMLGYNNLFVEIQYHGLQSEKYCYGTLISIAKELGLRLVAANDAHMSSNTEDEITRRNVAKFLRYGSLFDESEEEILAEKEMYLKDTLELSEWLEKVFPKEAVRSAINNTNVIGDICHVTPDASPHYPVYDKNVDAKALLRKKAYDGLAAKLQNKGGITDEYKERLERELDVICNMGYADYHLIVADFIEYGNLLGTVPEKEIPNAPLSIEELRAWCKENGYDTGTGIGPGRGSAAGSLVCYGVNITNIDPIKYGLLFERFLNPERYSMPDIDVDFNMSIRDQVVKYVTHKYGEKAICHILTKSYEGTKGAIRDAARYYGAVNSGDSKEYLTLSNAIRKNVPNLLGASFNTPMKAVNDSYSSDETIYDYLQGLYENDNNAIEILKIARTIEGSFFGYGVHAAGIVISDNDDLTEHIPLRYNDKLACFTTCCTKEQVEASGLLKMDFLNLRNLNIITDTLQLIKKNHGISLDAMNLPIEAEVIEEIFAKGRTVGVFQFESAGMRKYLKQMHPTELEDLFIMNAMYRPGPMQFIDTVCDIKNGISEESYLCEELKPILSVTYSAIIYQEQVMQICQKLAGYSMGQADMVRKYMSKKLEEELISEQQSFVYGDTERNIRGCVNNGIKEDVAIEIFGQMVDFAKYAFNKSHAAAYSVIAYATGYLKYHFPAEYLCSLLNYTAKVEDYMPIIQDAREMGVEVLPPDINHSGIGFTVRNGKILFGLGSIKGVKSGAEVIIENRKEQPYKDFKDYILRSSSTDAVNTTLIRCGAFDDMGYSRASLDGYCCETISSLAKKINECRDDIKEVEKAILVLENHSDVSEISDLQKLFNQNNVAITLKVKKCPTADSYRKKLITLRDKLEASEEELKNFEIRFISTDKQAYLSYEREGFGIYLTGHPTDGYKLPGLNTISDITDCDTSVFGVVTDITVRTTKAKKEWASVTVEDVSGQMRVVIFSNEYEDNKSILSLGSILKFDGDISVDEFYSSDDKTVYSMIASKITKITASNGIYVMDFKNYAEYQEKRNIINQCKQENGVTMYAYMCDTCRFIKFKSTYNEESVSKAGAYVIK